MAYSMPALAASHYLSCSLQICAEHEKIVLSSMQGRPWTFFLLLVLCRMVSSSTGYLTAGSLLSCLSNGTEM